MLQSMMMWLGVVANCKAVGGLGGGVPWIVGPERGGPPEGGWARARRRGFGMYVTVT